MGLRVLDEKVLDGFSLEVIACKNCSGYGACGYKCYCLRPAGGVAVICMRRRRMAQCERDGIGYSENWMK